MTRDYNAVQSYDRALQIAEARYMAGYTVNEQLAFAALLHAQKKAMAEFVTAEYWRLQMIRIAPHQEPRDSLADSERFKSRVTFA